jgi:hypothetical protein
MPVYAAITPTLSGAEASLDALNNSAFYGEVLKNPTTASVMATGTRSHGAALGRFERLFVFMVDPTSSRGASVYSSFIASAAFASCLMLCMQTLDGPNQGSSVPEYPQLPTKTGYFDSDLVFTVIFTPELLVRAVIWPSMWKEHEYLTEHGLRPFLRDLFNWFDVAAIIPFYIDLVFGEDKSFVIMRLCRLLRIFKLARNHSGTYILVRAIRASLAPISVALIFFMEIVFFFSVVMYMVDPNLDRNKAGFSDLLTSGYFVVVTIATIGYGDITPTKGNVASRLFAVMIMMSGTLFLSMPLAIIGTEFDRAWKQHAESVRKLQEQGYTAGIDAILASSSSSAAGKSALPQQKHEILVKYNAPNKLYLRLAALTGEASLMVQALFNEAKSSEMSVTSLREITDDLKQQVELCSLKSEELGVMVNEMIVAHVEEVKETPTWKQWVYTTLSDSNSSRTAKGISRWINLCLICSMIVVVFQTMPELQTYGETTVLCERKVRLYCEGVTSVSPGGDDPGCFTVDDPSVRIRFSCSEDDKLTDSTCFGYGYNFGSAKPAVGLSCSNSSDMSLTPKVPLSKLGQQYASLSFKDKLTLINPFRVDTQLSSTERDLSVCKKWECDNRHVTFLEFGGAYVAAEYIFTLTYLFEFSAAVFVASNMRSFFKNPLVYIEMASFIPFFVFEGRRFFTTTDPIYVIPPGSQDFLTFLRLLRLSRIFKIQQSIPVTKVLWESISKTSTRLTIPYFMLMVVTTILAFIMFEIEKGTECFYGEECIVAGKNMTFPDDLVGSPLGKRFLVNVKGNISTFDDFFSAFWFVIVTLTTIGYGDMEAVTTAGKLVAVIAMIFGACYTAMPLTLVGSQFNKSYREHKRREALLRTKLEVGKPYVVQQFEFELWTEFAKNEGFTAMLRRVSDELDPLVDEMDRQETIADENREAMVELATELKKLVYTQRVRDDVVASVLCGWLTD